MPAGHVRGYCAPRSVTRIQELAEASRLGRIFRRRCAPFRTADLCALIANHYGNRITELWRDGNSPVTEVEIFVLSDAEDARTQTPPKAPSEIAVSAIRR